jgi:hypothetical protein
MSMPAIYSALGRDEARNSVIFDDVLTALEAGRCPLILTERRDHLETLRVRFGRFTRNLVVLHGGMAAGELRSAQAGLQPGGSGERLVLATGRYLGEGFEDSRLDTLFLVMPISWTGSTARLPAYRAACCRHPLTIWKHIRSNDFSVFWLDNLVSCHIQYPLKQQVNLYLAKYTSIVPNKVTHAQASH